MSIGAAVESGADTAARRLITESTIITAERAQKEGTVANQFSSLF
jgi:hypothetical protein